MSSFTVYLQLFLYAKCKCFQSKKKKKKPSKNELASPFQHFCSGAYLELSCRVSVWLRDTSAHRQRKLFVVLKQASTDASVG